MVLYEYFFSSPVAKILSAWWVTEENLGCLKRPFPEWVFPVLVHALVHNTPPKSGSHPNFATLGI